ncbi:hypothetical protein [Aegicerativicinus sediminis]|uniref:hypothetical protein n=1 Tax=Aegicerativicinus sediminis TaxID=2893202 RepID=UPI001E2DC387|nr:hypothetical protein [Aegicerativicinus sediminis]
MRRLFILTFVLTFVMPLRAQNQLPEKFFLIMELMKVDNEQEDSYWETEEFWQKIHEKRVEAGEIIGWDLWQLLPGGEDQGYQYATVTVFSDAKKMLGPSDLMASAKKAYPNMSEADLNKKLNSASKTRDLAVRLFLEVLAHTKGDFEIKEGILANIDFMKADFSNYDAYETMEQKIFQPMHQQQVDRGEKGSWELLRIMIPIGSEAFASHITVNMFENLDQLLMEGEGMTFTPAQQKEMQEGMETRDQKWTYLARLVRMVR